MDRFNVDLREWRELDNRSKKGLSDWEREVKRKGFLKRCPHCNNAYTWEHLGYDPKSCASCGGREGDLVL